MTHQEKASVMYRIISGKSRCRVLSQTFLIITPTPDILYEAFDLYHHTILKHRFDNWLSKKDAIRLLIGNEIWPLDGDTNLKELETVIEDLKVKLFHSVMGSPKAQDDLRKRLRLTQKKYDELLSKKHLLDYMTIEGFAELVKQRFIYFHTTHTNNEDRVWDSMSECDGILLDAIMTAHQRQALDLSEYREIARTEPWRTHWNCYKDILLTTNTCNDEKRSLILFTKMYDNAYESIDCPTDDVLNDDDMFDGWLIYQRREREKDKMDTHLDKLNKGPGKGKRAARKHEPNEFFTVAESQKEANLIYNRNDTTGKMIQKQRATTIQAKGEVVEADLPDVRRNLVQQSNQMFINTMKKGK